MTQRAYSRSAAFLLLLAAACTDVNRPNFQGAAVRIYLGSAAYDEQTIAVGQTILLTASLIDGTGKKVDGETVEWRSAQPEIATVTAGGVVTAVAVGTANIIARHRVGEDTARVNVAQPITGALACAPGEELTFTLGESKTFTGIEATKICLAGLAEYAISVGNQGSTAAASLLTRMQSVGTRNAIFGPTPLLAPYRQETEVATDRGFHHHLRHEVSARLESRLRAGVQPGLLPSAPRLQTSVGQVLTFNVESTSGDGCSSPVMRGFRVRAISERAIVVADTLNPAGGFTDTDFQDFANFFDAEVWPLDTSTFGDPSDIDKNGKVFILFTRAVNERPENSGASGGSFVGGFFFNRDLFPTSGQSACAGSNVGEMFYMLVPNPAPRPGERVFSKDFVTRNTRTVLTHEFQHLINDSRRLHISKSLVWEETWLNEGLSHIAEELMFYRRSGLSPRGNLSETVFQSNPLARSQFELFQLDNLSRLAYFLRDPDTSSVMGPDGLATRGISWLFLRYTADRRGGDEGTFWRALVRDPKTAGLTNLELALGTDPKPWIGDFLAALYLDDAGFAATEPRFTVPSWNLRRLFPASGGLWPSGGFYATYPLKVYRTDFPNDHSVSLQGGGAAFYRGGVNTGQRGAIRFTVGNLPPPGRLRVVVTRTR